VVLVGVAALVASGSTHSLPLFIASSVLTGARYSLVFAGGLGVIARDAPPRHRAAVISAVYAIGYLAQSGSAVALGFIAASSGLLVAIELARDRGTRCRLRAVRERGPAERSHPAVYHPLSQTGAVSHAATASRHRRRRRARARPRR
jgi:hypothetical protein